MAGHNGRGGGGHAPGGAQGEEVLARARRHVAVQLDVEVAVRGVQPHVPWPGEEDSVYGSGLELGVNGSGFRV